MCVSTVSRGRDSMPEPKPSITPELRTSDWNTSIVQSLRLSETLPVFALYSVARRSYSFAFCSACFFTMSAATALGLIVGGRIVGRTIVLHLCLRRSELLLEILNLLGLITTGGLAGLSMSSSELLKDVDKTSRTEFLSLAYSSWVWMRSSRM